MSEIRVTDIKGEDGSAAVNFSKGINISSGVCTATSFSGSGANLTSLPAGQLTGTVADARISTLTASKLTGALPAISGANLTGISAGITMADQWRVHTNFNSSSSSHLVGSNWERNDTFFDKIGTGMSESSGVFTFPSTGIYLILWQHNCQGSNMQYQGSYAEISPDNGSSYYARAENYDAGGGTGHFSSINFQFMLDVTNASLYKVRFRVASSGAITNEGSTNAQRTGATFIRLGDT
tara:strand:- start:720 stop:1433 length:714 start_codon:yes stop_codon:yes gene_type:complete